MSKSLWAVNFISSGHNFGSGVITLDGDQVYGGDHGYYYLGKCLISGSSVNATVTVTKHDQSAVSILGNIQSFKLVLTGNGNVDVGSISLSGHMENNPHMKLTATMRKLVNLV
jgi:hypothetical protein